jgi:drug/metabolite transporter (DMT)-like permease
MSHIKTIVMVGFVMGTHGLAYMLVKDIDFSFSYIINYLPVSSLYIASMLTGYFGLRYIELSLSSPVQNSSGAIAAILVFVFFTHTLSVLEAGAIILITTGILSLTALESREKWNMPALKENERGFPHRFLVLTFPLIYCFLDGLGTFADAIYLDELSLMSEDNALLAYEFTFFFCAVIAFAVLIAKKQRVRLREEKSRGIAAVFETTGQVFYVYAMAQNAIIVAPLIASYSVFSVILSRMFLKERLNRLQYLSIVTVILGIVMLALAEIR